MNLESETYSLFEVWSFWAEGQLKPTDILYHVPILWWGRLGLFADFAASILLIVDASKLACFQRLSAWVREWDTWVTHKPSRFRLDPEPIKPFGGSFAMGLFAFGPLAAFLVIMWIRQEVTGIDNLDVWIANICGASRFCQEAILPGFVILFLWVGLFVVRPMFVRFILWTIKLPKLPALFRVFAVFLLIFGFHFILLSM